jgi:hypothetical protein
VASKYFTKQNRTVGILNTEDAQWKSFYQQYC